MLPGRADVVAAAARLAGKARRTPLLPLERLSAELGRPVLAKAECLQRTGSFKFRGAYNTLAGLAPDAARAGVVAFSSGNHGAGVAAAAAALGISAKIVMPSDAPAAKRRNVEAYGAEVVPYERGREDREAMARAIAEREGRTLVRPFDAASVIAGQGTAGLEIAEDVAALGLELAAVLVPTGGGGLVAGIGLALDAAVEVFAVEPEGFDDTARSLAAGERQSNASETGSICDALLVPTPGVLTFELNRRRLAGALTVSDAEAAAGLRRAFSELKLVVEPSGAVALAAALSRRLPKGEGAVVVVLSGGNVDTALYARLLMEED